MKKQTRVKNSVKVFNTHVNDCKTVFFPPLVGKSRSNFIYKKKINTDL